MATSAGSPTKAALREGALERRLTIGKAEAAAAAKRAAEHAVGWLGVVAGQSVALYMPVRGEIDPAPLGAQLSAAGARLLLPMVIDLEGPLVFRLWLPDDPLEPGYGRIPEPRADAPIMRPHSIVVPLAAFDRRCYRIGYGQGHYDRTLAALRAEGEVAALGYAYGVQEVERVPNQPHDQPLDAIATERELVVRDMTPDIGLPAA
jgi:5-formyltetrahydrofolate cyclo-ligase